MKTLLTLTIAAATLVGCQARPQAPAAAAPVSAQQLQDLRTAFTQADANARLGSVDAVLESSAYLTVGQIDPADFPVGTAVAIIDANRQVIANGEVVRTFDQTVHVRYEKAGARAPQVGDVAVRF
jgi:hypothetical protein